MIILHKLNGDEFVLNVDHIEVVEETPDTIITLGNEKKYIVKENKEEIINLALEYLSKIHSYEKYKNL